MNENNGKYVESQKYQNLPVEKWPKFKIQWDLKSSSQRFALDNFSEQLFNERYPNGLLLGEINLKELLRCLPLGSRWEDSNIWSVGAKPKIERAILFWKSGNKMSPPLICLSDSESLIIGGGYNRIAVCIAKNITKMPILVLPSEKNEVEKKLITVKWM